MGAIKRLLVSPKEQAIIELQAQRIAEEIGKMLDARAWRRAETEEEGR